MRIRGGLGNQLFQYAAGRAVAERTGTRLRLDACYCAADPLREFELDRFRVRAKVVRGPVESAAYIDDDILEDAWVRGRYGAETVRELRFRYSDVLEHAGPNSFLCGYFHSARYFESIERKLRAELRPKRLGRTARALRRRIAGTEQSVAVHVRRGDVVSDPNLRRLIASVEPDYYARAGDMIREYRSDPHFFVFSDDPAWCRANIDLPGKTEVVSGSTDGVEDLALISTCSDAVIANSTFSWWGAWLGETAGSIVVTPARWRNTHPQDAPDVRPTHWKMV
ncbi:MAG: alpha-1,2-fucosyltransferase [Solirubrobacterales bacterium]